MSKKPPRQTTIDYLVDNLRLLREMARDDGKLDVLHYMIEMALLEAIDEAARRKRTPLAHTGSNKTTH